MYKLSWSCVVTRSKAIPMGNVYIKNYFDMILITKSHENGNEKRCSIIVAIVFKFSLSQLHL